MHAKAKQEIKECYEKNKRGDAAYKSLTQSMKSRLRATVGETYWKKAHNYLDHFFKQKTREQQQGPVASTGGVPRSVVSSTSPNTNPSQKKREADKLLQRTVSELDDG